MKKLYEKNDLLFAILFIIAYCVVCTSIKNSFGGESGAMLAALAVIAAVIFIFVKKVNLSEKYGLIKWQGTAKDYLYFIPMLILSTGNLWGGVAPAYSGISQVFAVVSMVLIGFIEEMIFRGFLFRALLKRNSAPKAITISAVTFGIGHIINLLTGRGGFETVIQIFFAVALGFIFTFVFYKSGSLWVCIAVHGLIDVFSEFASPESSFHNSRYVYAIVTIIVSVFYCIYLNKKPTALNPE